MSNIFDYQFNVGGNFTAAVETSTKGLAKWEQKFAVFGLANEVITRRKGLYNEENFLLEVR